MSLREQLELIYNQHGRLTPTIVVETARDPLHPLHSRLEWDDTIAGEAYRRDQAHELIQSVRIKYHKHDGEPGSVRAFFAVHDNGKGITYRPTDEILQDPLQTKLILADMERDWKTLKARYDQFIEFRELVAGDLGLAK